METVSLGILILIVLVVIVTTGLVFGVFGAYALGTLRRASRHRSNT
ncbi:hypothetical protein QIP99_gp3 [ssRNA phage Gerhypos.1_17]|uniref:Uncharacterized protein n=1 Tax=ssRNA phage Gerhypos.1_17 TaxID=2786198 RepID=A0A8S5L3Q4_9VIRU|nr:hypothetical protein QIP99_gp3 [ssRNA phage Gerhypos.1_17]DAD51957.1 TPA_asm: hypothetical protein [ssRNA phage Gerhypos.1_17]